jgi:beta-phosphoglucomutase
MLKGVLFDMDGVLVDSEEYICLAAIEMFKELGYTTTPSDFKRFTGTGENRYIGGVAEKYGIPIDINIVKARTYEIYGQLVRGQLTPLPGAEELLSEDAGKKGSVLDLQQAPTGLKWRST